MKPDVKLLGLADIQKQFDALLMSTKEGKSVLRGTLRRTFIQTIKDARANLDAGGHNKTGNLRRSLGTIISIKPGTAYAAIVARTCELRERERTEAQPRKPLFLIMQYGKTSAASP